MCLKSIHQMNYLEHNVRFNRTIFRTMELRQLRYFLSLAEAEHLTQSAQNLFITQSTLSHGLRQLEDKLETVLFDRIGRSLKISKAGMAYKSFVGRAIQALKAGRIALAQLKDLQSVTLTVGVIPAFMESLCSLLWRTSVQATLAFVFRSGIFVLT